MMVVVFECGMVAEPPCGLKAEGGVGQRGEAWDAGHSVLYALISLP